MSLGKSVRLYPDRWHTRAVRFLLGKRLSQHAPAGCSRREGLLGQGRHLVHGGPDVLSGQIGELNPSNAGEQWLQLRCYGSADRPVWAPCLRSRC